jgi:hypothetical protein
MSRFGKIRDRNFLQVRPIKKVTMSKCVKVTKLVRDAGLTGVNWETGKIG